MPLLTVSVSPPGRTRHPTGVGLALVDSPSRKEAETPQRIRDISASFDLTAVNRSKLTALPALMVGHRKHFAATLLLHTCKAIELYTRAATCLKPLGQRWVNNKINEQVDYRHRYQPQHAVSVPTKPALQQAGYLFEQHCQQQGRQQVHNIDQPYLPPVGIDATCHRDKRSSTRRTTAPHTRPITCNHSASKTGGRTRSNAADAGRAGNSAYQSTSPCRQRQISSIDTSTTGLATEISSNANGCTTDCTNRAKGACHQLEFFYCDIAHYYNSLWFYKKKFSVCPSVTRARSAF